jgi:hypothetical protein
MFKLGRITHTTMNLDSDDIRVYASVAIALFIWAALSFSGWSSLRWSRHSPDTRRVACFIFASLPLLLGLVCFKAEIRWSGEDDWFSFDLSWLFLLPVALGIAALLTWFRARGRLHHVTY